jgi:hypothetical protein
VERVVSPVLPVHSLEEVRGSTPVETPYFAQTNEPTNGCHVAAHDWATWHHIIHTNQCNLSTTDYSTCLPSFQLRAPMSLPCQHATVSATSSCTTCHPYSGDTCHPLTSPIPVILHITCCMSSLGASTSNVRPVHSSCHVALYGL